MSRIKTITDTLVNFTLLADIAASDGPQYIFSPETIEDVDRLGADMKAILEERYGKRAVGNYVDDFDTLYRFYNCGGFVEWHRYILVYDFSTCSFTVFDLSTLHAFLCAEYKYIEGCVDSMMKEK